MEDGGFLEHTPMRGAAPSFALPRTPRSREADIASPVVGVFDIR
jgi:hypothetical protein